MLLIKLKENVECPELQKEFLQICQPLYFYFFVYCGVIRLVMYAR